MGIGVIFGNRVGEIAQIAETPADQLIEKMTRESIRFEWPATTDAAIDEAMDLVYDQGPFDFPFRPQRDLTPTDAAAGSYRIVSRVYPFLPPLADGMGFFMRQVTVADAALLGYIEALRSISRGDWRARLWLDGQSPDPSWANDDLLG
jgi:hypothetical protein